MKKYVLRLNEHVEYNEKYYKELLKVHKNCSLMQKFSKLTEKLQRINFASNDINLNLLYSKEIEYLKTQDKLNIKSGKLGTCLGISIYNACPLSLSMMQTI